MGRHRYTVIGADHGSERVAPHQLGNLGGAARRVFGEGVHAALTHWRLAGCHPRPNTGGEPPRRRWPPPRSRSPRLRGACGFPGAAPPAPARPRRPARRPGGPWHLARPGRPTPGPPFRAGRPTRPPASSAAPVRSTAARRPAAARYRCAATAPGRPPGYAPCARSARRVLPAAPATRTPDAGAPARAHRTTRAARRGPAAPSFSFYGALRHSGLVVWVVAPRVSHGFGPFSSCEEAWIPGRLRVWSVGRLARLQEPVG